jgi:hypothetical protein
MPANGPTVTVNLTVAALDGANRSAASTIAVSIAGNQSAPINSAPTPSSGGGGGALNEWALAMLLLVTGRAIRARRRLFARPVYSGIPAALAH